jgi:hypothetical protein
MNKRPFLLLLAFCLWQTAPTQAAEVLFEDVFGGGVSSQPGSADLNLEIAARQQGPLAPARYGESGGDWQTQMNPKGQFMVAALFTVAPWLTISPEWELKPEDGSYSLTWEYSNLPAGQGPDESMLGIGRAEMTPMESEAGISTAAFVVIVPEDVAQPVRVFYDGNQVAEAVAAADQLNHAITIKWKQTGGKISALRVLVDGNELKGDFGESITLGQPRVVFGTRMGVQPGAADWAVSELERLEYSKD